MEIKIEGGKVFFCVIFWSVPSKLPLLYRNIENSDFKSVLYKFFFYIIDRFVRYRMNKVIINLYFYQTLSSFTVHFVIFVPITLKITYRAVPFIFSTNVCFTFFHKFTQDGIVC